MCLDSIGSGIFNHMQKSDKTIEIFCLIVLVMALIALFISHEVNKEMEQSVPQGTSSIVTPVASPVPVTIPPVEGSQSCVGPCKG